MASSTGLSGMASHCDGLADVIGHLYDAALDARLWDGISAKIATALDSTSTAVKLHSTHDCFTLLETTDNLVVTERLQSWSDHWHSHDLWVDRSMAYGLSRIVMSHELVPESEQNSSGYYQEWLSPLGIWHMIGAVFPTDDGALGVLGIHRPKDAGHYNDDDRRKVGLLLPHLQRAMRLGQRVAQAERARDITFESLDALDTGVMIVEGCGRVIHANVIAEGMLRENAGLTARDGYLRAAEPALNTRLRKAIVESVALAEGVLYPASAAIRIDRANGPPWTLSVAPLRPRWSQLAVSAPMALILMRDPEYPPMLIESLRALFDLTRTEALVAANLSRGRALPQIAADLGIGIMTVRSHLKRILLKTNTCRQGEVIAVISRSVATLGGAA